MPIVRAVSYVPARLRSRSVSTQLAFGVADQAVVAMSSIGVTVVFARSLTAEAFGAVALVLLARVFVIEFGRAAVAIPAQLDDDPAANSAAPFAVALVLGSFAGAVGLAASLLLPHARQALAIVALSLPFLLLFEVVRHLLVTDGRSVDALRLDAGVALVQGGFLATSLLTGWSIGPVGHLVVWVGAGSLAALVGSTMLTAGPWTLRAARWWWESTRPIRRGLVSDMLWSQLQRQSVPWFLGGVGSLAVVAGFRGSQTAFRPLALITTGVRMIAVPSLRRARSVGATNVRTQSVEPTVAVSVLLSLIAGAALVAMSLAPESAGRAVFGETWPAMVPLLLPVGLAQLGQAAAVGPQVGLVASGAADRLARTRRVAVSTLLIGTVSAGLAWGATAAVWTLGLFSLAQIPCWWWVSITARPPADSEQPVPCLMEAPQ